MNTLIDQTVAPTSKIKGVTVENIAALRALDSSALESAVVLGYRSENDGGGGNYHIDKNDVTSVDDGGALIVGADGSRWKLLHNGAISVKQFGVISMDSDPNADNSSALLSVELFLRGELGVFRALPSIIFPAGTYKYSASPNFGVQGATILNEGKVKLRYTGVDRGMILDGGSGAGVNITGLTFGKGQGFIIEAPSTASIGIHIQNVYLSKITARCWGAGLSSAGFVVQGCVLTEFWIGCTPTESAREEPGDYINGWYLGARPFVGMTLTESGPGAQSSYCTFYNWLGAACQIGMYVDSTLGNVFLGGDNEYNSSIGAVFTPKAIGNKIKAMNFEVNSAGGDVQCAGFYNEFDVDSTLFQFVAGEGNRLMGGMHDQVSILGGTGNYVGGIVYGRGISGNLPIIDEGIDSAFGPCFQAQEKRWSMGPKSDSPIAVGNSPFVYRNTSNRHQRIFISGGTITAVSYHREGTLLGTLSTNQYIDVLPGDSLTVAYTIAPTMHRSTP